VSERIPLQPRQGLGAEQAFERATTLHRRGRLGEAKPLYRLILDHNPDHFGALYHLGIILGQQGSPAEAEQLLRHALTQNPRSTEARNYLGVVLHGLGRLDQALLEYRKVVAIDPRHIEAQTNLGNVLHMLGRSGEAIAHFDSAVILRPDLADLHNNLGNALRVVNRLPEAITSFHRALTIRSDFAEARNNLGVALAQAGNFAAAIAEYQQAIALRPDYFEARSNFANTLAALGRHEEAIAQFETSLSIRPDAPAILNNFGNLLARLKRHQEAVAQYRKAIRLKPEFFEAHNNLGNVLAASEPADAIAHFRKALDINPDYADALINLGNVLGGLERYEEAISCYRQALVIEPASAGTYYCLGNALITLGRIDQGREALETAIELAPDHPEFYRSLGECKRFTADDPHLAAMEALAKNMDALAEDQRIVLHFGLSKAYSDLDRHQSAFRHLREANGLRRRQVDYDEAATLALHQRVIEVFDPEFIRSKAAPGDSSAVPIFILGMPRSGTTLIEQVLASHPSVHGAGEILALHHAVHHRGNTDETPSHGFPEALTTVPPEQFRAIGDRYLSEIATLAPEAGRIVDKALGNFVFAGLIHMTLPNARIIHARRDPIDTCVSCYSKLFAAELLYTYDLAELGRYYRSYQTLMEHWRTVLPQGAMLEMQYEELVSDFEAQARRIVRYCGLDWDDRCLAFHQTERPVRTASATQVRQPIYQASVGRWRPYEAMLQPLIAELRSRTSVI
jgi:tetratricopeptide (TPR) repeat protein